MGERGLGGGGSREAGQGSGCRSPQFGRDLDHTCPATPCRLEPLPCSHLTWHLLSVKHRVTLLSGSLPDAGEALIS